VSGLVEAKAVVADPPSQVFSTNVFWDRAIAIGRCHGLVHEGLWFDVGYPAAIAMTEAAFLGTYGSPVLQAMVGLGTPAASSERRINRDLVREAAELRQNAELEQHFEVGGLPEAIVRAVIHVRLPEGRIDERGFAALQALRRARPANRRLTFGEVKALFRDQYLLIRLDEERAVRAIPKLLPDSEPQRSAAWEAVCEVIAARGELPGEGKRRLDRLQELFGVTQHQAAAE